MNTISNYCRFIGRLAGDPKLIKLENTDLLTFTLAVSEYRREKNGDKKKTVSYLDFEAWDSGATTLNKYCKKGDIVDLVASARNNSWVDKEGNKKFQIRFRVKEFKLFNNNHSDTQAEDFTQEAKPAEIIDSTDE
tara:strand:- start:1463 stop:1867 length:405 start_codon:yes stop_codon:yes gene_type:complete